MEEDFWAMEAGMKSWPMLSFPYVDELFVVDTDAMTVAESSDLSQSKQDEKFHKLPYASRTMNIAERKYSTC